MLRPSTDIPSGEGVPASLRANFTATFAGNALFAASQWAVMSLIAKLGSGEMLGQYALAVAIATPVAFLSHMNLRSVLATDVERRRPFGDYVAVRLWITAAGLAVLLGIAGISRYPWPVAAVTLLIGIALSSDNVSDIYYGALQRRERMTPVAHSTMARGLLSAGALGMTLWLTGNLLAGAAAMALARLAVLLVHDVPIASAGESLSRSGIAAQGRIFRTSLPLGITLMLIALTANLPRYAIEHRLGAEGLGYFAAVASFLTVGTTVVNALGQSATPRLARYFSVHDTRRFSRLAWQLVGLAAALGVAGVLVAALLGHFVLALVYRPGYAAYSALLVWMMAAGILNYVASMLGYVITSTRTFAAQVPLFAAVAAGSGLMSQALVPRFGLEGAAGALAAAWTVQIGGEMVILRRALRTREQAR